MAVVCRRNDVVWVCGEEGGRDAVGVMECEGVRRGGEEAGGEDVGEGEESVGYLYPRN